MAINNISLITRFAARQSHANNSGTVRALCNGYSYYYNRHTYIYALILIDLYGYCYVYMHACATAKLQRQRTRGAMTPREGGTAAAGHTKL